MTEHSDIPGAAIVIAGMAVEAPGGIETPEDFYAALAAGDDLIGPMPRDRDWDVDRVLSLDQLDGWGTVPDAGGFLDGAAEFDPQFFGLSPREATAMDPQQRVAMRVAWRAVENAGINPGALASTDVGVYFGASLMEYGPRAAGVNEYSGHRIAGTALGAVAGRIAHALGVTGPAVVVDTACASSLTAVHQAAAAVRAGECDWAIAGGVCVMASPGAFYEFSRSNALAADGRCHSYAEDATGTVWAEGAGAVIVETAAHARAHGHRIHAVIAGSRINHNGGGGPIVVPSEQAQQRVITGALAAADIDAAVVDLIEGHGTATLGDPMELSALAATYGAARRADRGAGHGVDRPVAVGSVKSNAGHAQAASGILGLIKVLQCGRNGTIVPTRYADRPTTRIDWADSGLRLPDAAESWPARDGHRYAAISSFGVSGTNAHLIVDMPEVTRV